jgi:hypothetical protein
MPFLGAVFVGSLVLTPSADAYLGGLFKGYIEGSESARAQNYLERQSAAYVWQATVNNLIQAYNISGNFDYLCEAWALGSRSAGQALLESDMRCRREIVTVVR